MSKIKDIVVLNTVTANGTDASVDSNGLFNVVGLDPIKAERITDMVITPYVAETLQVTTVTIGTVTDGATYTLAIQGINRQTKATYFQSYSVVAGTGASTTTICDAFRAAIGTDPYVNVTVSGTTTLILTGVSGFPAFSVIENDAKLSASTGTPAVIGSGLGSTITAQYPASQFPEISNIVAAGQYTTVRINYEDIFAYGENNTLGNSYNDMLLFVREGVTNFNDLLGTYGTLTGLNAGYRVTLSAITGTAGSNTANVQTMTSGVLGTEDVVAGDFIVGDTGSAANTVRKVISTLTQTTFLTTTATAITGSTFRVAKWRALPL